MTSLSVAFRALNLLVVWTSIAAFGIASLGSQSSLLASTSDEADALMAELRAEYRRVEFGQPANRDLIRDVSENLIVMTRLLASEYSDTPKTLLALRWAHQNVMEFIQIHKMFDKAAELFNDIARKYGKNAAVVLTSLEIMERFVAPKLAYELVYDHGGVGGTVALTPFLHQEYISIPALIAYTAIKARVLRWRLADPIRFWGDRTLLKELELLRRNILGVDPEMLALRVELRTGLGLNDPKTVLSISKQKMRDRFSAFIQRKMGSLLVAPNQHVLTTGGLEEFLGDSVLAKTIRDLAGDHLESHVGLLLEAVLSGEDSRSKFAKWLQVQRPDFPISSNGSLKFDPLQKFPMPDKLDDGSSLTHVLHSSVIRSQAEIGLLEEEIKTKSNRLFSAKHDWRFESRTLLATRRAMRHIDTEWNVFEKLDIEWLGTLRANGYEGIGSDAEVKGYAEMKLQLAQAMDAHVKNRANLERILVVLDEFEKNPHDDIHSFQNALGLDSCLRSRLHQTFVNIWKY